MSNTQVLSSGSEVYAKKRKARQEQLTEVSFDPEARKYDRLPDQQWQSSKTTVFSYTYMTSRRLTDPRLFS